MYYISLTQLFYTFMDKSFIEARGPINEYTLKFGSCGRISKKQIESKEKKIYKERKREQRKENVKAVCNLYELNTQSDL